MKLFCVSDTFGALPEIPKDYQNSKAVLVLAGNICPDFEEDWTYERRVPEGFVGTPGRGEFWKQPAQTVGRQGFWNFIRIDRTSTAKRQLEWIRRTLVPHLLKFKLNPQRVIWVGGPHEFCAVEEIFPLSVFQGARAVEVDGVEIALLSGSPQIVGQWSDEIAEEEFQRRISSLPKTCEIMVSHTPGFALLDKNADGDNLGSLEITHGVAGEWGLGFPHFNKLTLHIHGGAPHSAGEFSQEIKRSGSILSQKFNFDHTLRIFNAGAGGRGIEFEK